MTDLNKVIATLWDVEATSSTIDEWCLTLGHSVADFYDASGLLIARAFDCGSLSYEYCDDAVNALWGSFVERGELDPFPKLFYEVYEAFDAGEYVHDDMPDADPVTAYTRPMIAHIVARLS